MHVVHLSVPTRELVLSALHSRFEGLCLIPWITYFGSHVDINRLIDL